MGRAFISLAMFVASLFAMAVLCTVVWQVVGDKLYDCTDDGVLGFWRPGDWVHSWGGRPVATVREIVHGRPMSEPDTIKQGWTVADLWHLWYAFVAASFIISVLLAWIPWLPARDRASPGPHRDSS